MIIPYVMHLAEGDRVMETELLLLIRGGRYSFNCLLRRMMRESFQSDGGTETFPV